jgi:hypothetical protein
MDEKARLVLGLLDVYDRVAFGYVEEHAVNNS